MSVTRIPHGTFRILEKKTDGILIMEIWRQHVIQFLMIGGEIILYKKESKTAP